MRAETISFPGQEKPVCSSSGREFRSAENGETIVLRDANHSYKSKDATKGTWSDACVSNRAHL